MLIIFCCSSLKKRWDNVDNVEDEDEYEDDDEFEDDDENQDLNLNDDEGNDVDEDTPDHLHWVRHGHVPRALAEQAAQGGGYGVQAEGLHHLKSSTVFPSTSACAFHPTLKREENTVLKD